ncbi:MAG TPA: helix-turn-helix transcriptional regulator [Rhizomicrobium sp.]|nr:helix-turn-helix transcriptional regulator [Rhizomicrobium sp.]
MPKANSHSIDKAIGGRLKLYRQRANLSQTALGRHLGVSFQQVQKYENGTNRISAASLMKIARFLNISIADLLASNGKQGGKSSAVARSDVARFARTSEGRSLIHGFLAIEDPHLRRHIVGLVKALGQRAG